MARKSTGPKDWNLSLRLSKKQQTACDLLIKKIDCATYTNLVKLGFKILCEQNHIEWPKDSDE